MDASWLIAGFGITAYLYEKGVFCRLKRRIKKWFYRPKRSTDKTDTTYRVASPFEFTNPRGDFIQSSGAISVAGGASGTGIIIPSPQREAKPNPWWEMSKWKHREQVLMANDYCEKSLEAISVQELLPAYSFEHPIPRPQCLSFDSFESDGTRLLTCIKQPLPGTQFCQRHTAPGAALDILYPEAKA